MDQLTVVKELHSLGLSIGNREVQNFLFQIYVSTDLSPPGDFDAEHCINCFLKIILILCQDVPNYRLLLSMMGFEQKVIDEAIQVILDPSIVPIEVDEETNEDVAVRFALTEWGSIIPDQEIYQEYDITRRTANYIFGLELPDMLNLFARKKYKIEGCKIDMLQNLYYYCVLISDFGKTVRDPVILTRHLEAVGFFQARHAKFFANQIAPRIQLSLMPRGKVTNRDFIESLQKYFRVKDTSPVNVALKLNIFKVIAYLIPTLCIGMHIWDTINPKNQINILLIFVYTISIILNTGAFFDNGEILFLFPVITALIILGVSMYGRAFAPKPWSKKTMQLLNIPYAVANLFLIILMYFYNT